ncbi:dihydrofolate reductase [Chryseomicrobium imtechense]
MIISLIAAISSNYVIGKDKDIPWKIPGEQVRFKNLTMGKTVIMGRKTFDSIGQPLPNRKTIIISKSKNIIHDNCLTVESLESAFNLLKQEDEIFIAGGGEIYKKSLPFADRIYLTVIDKEYEGNIFFPMFNKDKFEITYQKKIEGIIPYTYFTYERKN